MKGYSLDYKDFEKLLEQENKNQDEFTAKFNSFRGSMSERLFLVGANCFSDKRLNFRSLTPFQNLLTYEEMASLFHFKNKVLRNNECLGYAGTVINSTQFSYWIDLNAQSSMFEFCQIYYLIFERLVNEKLFPKDGQCKKDFEITSTFGKLHDYRGALNHNILDRGWLAAKGTTIKDLKLTQQEAIDELFAMLELAHKRHV